MCLSACGWGTGQSAGQALCPECILESSGMKGGKFLCVVEVFIYRMQGVFLYGIVSVCTE